MQSRTTRQEDASWNQEEDEDEPPDSNTEDHQQHAAAVLPAAVPSSPSVAQNQANQPDPSLTLLAQHHMLAMVGNQQMQHQSHQFQGTPTGVAAIPFLPPARYPALPLMSPSQLLLPPPGGIPVLARFHPPYMLVDPASATAFASITPLPPETIFLAPSVSPLVSLPPLLPMAGVSGNATNNATATVFTPGVALLPQGGGGGGDETAAGNSDEETSSEEVLDNDQSSTTSRKRFKRETWEAMLNKLIHYKQQNGNCVVPQDFRPDPKLGNWVQKQRALRKAGRLLPDRVKQLSDIGFVWKVQDTWEHMFECLVKYKAKHGDCNVPKSYRENPKLGKWIRVQRMRRNILPEDRLKRLQDIGYERTDNSEQNDTVEGK